MHEQLKAAGTSAHLAGLVGGAVGKALRLLAEKAEYMAAAGPELRQVRRRRRRRRVLRAACWRAAAAMAAAASARRRACLPAAVRAARRAQVSLGPSAGAGAAPAQQRNIALCSQLQEVHRSLSTLLPRLPGAASAALAPHLAALQATAVDLGAAAAAAAGRLLLPHAACAAARPRPARRRPAARRPPSVRSRAHLQGRDGGV